MDILAALYRLRDDALHGEIDSRSCGICLNLVRLISNADSFYEYSADMELDFESLYDNVHEVDEFLKEAFNTWDFAHPDYSFYPIGGYEEYYSDKMWEGDSLRKRIALIDYMIEMLEE